MRKEKKTQGLSFANRLFLPELSAAVRWGLAAWIGQMVLTPVALWTWGLDGFQAMTYPGAITQVVVCLVIISRNWSGRQILRLAAIILPLAWLVEFTGHTTGLPFGLYQYTSILQPQLGGVPLLIPFAWLMMLPPAWGVTARLVDPAQRWRFAAVSGLAFTAWDLFLDPQMVANGLWVWKQPGAYFGIPLLNFAGWWLASSLITAAVYPRAFPARPLAVIYTLTCVLEAIGLGLFWHQPGPALAGLLAMGLFATLFWIEQRSGQRNAS